MITRDGISLSPPSPLHRSNLAMVINRRSIRSQRNNEDPETSEGDYALGGGLFHRHYAKVKRETKKNGNRSPRFYYWYLLSRLRWCRSLPWHGSCSGNSYKSLMPRGSMDRKVDRFVTWRWINCSKCDFHSCVILRIFSQNRPSTAACVCRVWARVLCINIAFT